MSESNRGGRLSRRLSAMFGRKERTSREENDNHDSSVLSTYDFKLCPTWDDIRRQVTLPMAATSHVRSPLDSHESTPWMWNSTAPGPSSDSFDVFIRTRPESQFPPPSEGSASTSSWRQPTPVHATENHQHRKPPFEHRASDASSHLLDHPKPSVDPPIQDFAKQIAETRMLGDQIRRVCLNLAPPAAGHRSPEDPSVRTRRQILHIGEISIQMAEYIKNAQKAGCINDMVERECMTRALGHCLAAKNKELKLGEFYTHMMIMVDGIQKLLEKHQFSVGFAQVTAERG